MRYYKCWNEHDCRGAQLKTLTTPLTKFRYLGIMSLKSSVMKTLLTNSCDRDRWEVRKH